tara:strand:- start:29372 stop:31669 length:2298 start_codon:yes stop_codon:yes gene_type:complete
MNGTKVLIVEDDTNSAFILKTILLKQGFKIAATATSSEEALAAVKEHAIDLILMDIHIHGELDGIEAAKKILKERGIPIIYLTGASDKNTIQRAKETDPFGYILKPYSEQEIAIAIEMALYKAAMNAKLKASEEHLDVTLKSLHDGVISTDHQGYITYMNPAAEKITSSSDEEARGKSIESIFEIYNHQDPQKSYPIQDLIKNPSHEAWSQQPFSCQTPSKEHYYLNIQASLIKGSVTTENRYTIAIQDVTKQYESEKNMRMMAAALESIDDAVIVTLTNTQKGPPEIIYTNKGFERITQYSKEEALNHRLDLLMQGSSDPTFNNLLCNTLDAGCPATEETILYRKDKEDFPALCSAAPVYTEDNSISHLVFVIRDISKIKRIEENVRQSQKIESIGRLAGGIAHDFNNLLSVINSYSDILSLKLESSSPLVNYVENIRTAGDKGASLVSQLMAFSRQQAIKPEQIDLKQVASETQEMLSRVIWNQTEIFTDFGSEVYSINIGRGQIEQVLINLCVNARDAMPDGGSITLKLRNCTVANQKEESATPKIPGEYVLLSVSDTGTGMDKETAQRIFEPFFTTKAIGKGTGLGLSTVYGILKQVGGYIEVESELGKGTCFHLYFPAAADSMQSQANPEAAKQANVFIIDNDETFSDCISGLLSLNGYKVHNAATTAVALEQFSPQEKEENIFIISAQLLIDINEQEQKLLFGKIPNTHLIIISDKKNQDLPQLDSIKISILKKPFPLNKVLDKIKTLLSTSTQEPLNT